MLQTVGVWAAFTLVWVLCVAGVALSCLSLSGTWLVTVALMTALLMFVGSFALAFAAEYWHSSVAAHAMHVAIGAVLARVAVVFVKVVATLGMIGVLGFGVLLSG